tara:strand:+ start:7 stop:663 length:657 start_codon:yes stop_codon:yes gene_type:complete
MKKKFKKLKICGIKDPKILNFLIKKNVDYFGLIFFKKSPRYVDITKAYKLSKIANKKKIKTVGVFVNMRLDNLQKHIDKLNLKFIQLHGRESNSYINKIKRKNKNIKVIKVIKLNNLKDAINLNNFNEADFYLFDYKGRRSNELPGGNAKSFNWKILEKITINKEWFLSGGINKYNIKNAVNIKSIYGLDISSGVESKPGIKNINKINEIIEIIRKIK